MGISTQTTSAGLVIQKYIGSAYDNVKLVADNLTLINNVATTWGTDITTVAGLETEIQQIAGNQAFRAAAFNITGVPSIGLKDARWYPPGNITFTNLDAWMGVAPTTDVVFDVLKNGSVVGTGTITGGTNKMTSQTGLSIAVTPTDYLQVEITSASIDGTGLVVRLYY